MQLEDPLSRLRLGQIETVRLGIETLTSTFECVELMPMKGHEPWHDTHYGERGRDVSL